MATTDLLSPVIFLACIAMCSLAGLFVSSALPWSAATRSSSLACATGIGLGPFILGVGIILALALFRGASHATHSAVALGFVILIAAAVYLNRRAHQEKQANLSAFSSLEKLLFLLIVATVIALIFISLFIPLTQNDGLEYAIAARELYLTRDLASYPVLNPATNASGFYGPWTHPPLYVALLYMVNIAQGTADMPGLIKLISAWFLLCGAYLVYALGACINRLTGLLACLFFLSVPLLFLGAGSALIDPLPILGLVLVVTVGVGIDAKPVVHGGIVGCMLGMALWTHSQAIVFIPLAMICIVLKWGLWRIRAWFQAALGFLGLTILFGSWPYWRNMQLFGAAISDNPSVFAMPLLYWQEYFTMGRGLGTSIAMLQYGLLKGWFSPEAYGFIFFGMSVGIVFFLCHKNKAPAGTVIKQGMHAAALRDAVPWLLLGFFLVYMLGMLASIVLGIEHMVKNERYFLVMVPVAAVFCAYGCVQLLRVLRGKLPALHQVFLSALVVLYVAQIGVLLQHAASRVLPGELFKQSMDEKTQNIPELELVKFLDDNTSGDALVLSLKPADMYYSDRRMMSYLDERLLAFYEKKQAQDAYTVLQNLGVTHIHIPNYGIPPIYNSQLFMLLRDPAYTTLLYQTVAGQIYALRPEQAVAQPVTDISPEKRPWVLQRILALGGRKNMGTWTLTHAPLTDAAYTSTFAWFHRHLRTVASVGVASPDMLPTEEVALRVDPDSEYAIDLRLAGEGFIEIQLDQFAKESRDYALVKKTEITSFELSKRQPVRDYAFRFLTSPATKSIALNIKSTGSSRVHILAARQFKIVRNTP